ncbi:unnamed protein product [Anisakis simplex]|uniref:RRM domain-containing protein n=1 Tax=Anisakis simplex TaxID=6269 RepID=A0A0M3JWY2_ANISI|nr:unnamed protein product [Anisakis simplex]
MTTDPTSAETKMWLFQIGLVEKVVLHQYSDGNPKDALVVFNDVKSVNDAIRYLHKKDVYGERLCIRPLRGYARYDGAMNSGHCYAIKKTNNNGNKTQSDPSQRHKSSMPEFTQL